MSRRRWYPRSPSPSGGGATSAINCTDSEVLARHLARDRRFALDLAEYQRLGREELRCQVREAVTPPCSYGVLRVSSIRAKRAALLDRLREQLAEDATRNARPFPPEDI